MAIDDSRATSRFRKIFRSGEAKLVVAILTVFLIAGAIDPQHNYFHRATFAGSIDQIIQQTALLGIVALGAAVVIIAGGIDLSIGSMIAFSATICASIMLYLAPDEMNGTLKWYRLNSDEIAKFDVHEKLEKSALTNHWFSNEESFRQALDKALTPDEVRANPALIQVAERTKPIDTWVIVVAIAGAILSGFLVGSLHAWLITVVGLPPFIATLATLVGLRSMARVLCFQITRFKSGGSKSIINIFDDGFRTLTNEHWIPIVVCLLLLAVIWLFLQRTVAGRHIYALGGNEQAARLSGIRTENVKWLAYVISAIAASITGVLQLSYVSSADPQTQAVGYELNAIAAAVVGGCSLQGGVGTALGAVLGGMFMWTVLDGISKVIKANADTYQGWVVGVVVVLAVAFNQLRQSSSQSRNFFPGVLGYVSTVALALIAGLMGAALGDGNAGIGALIGTLVLLLGLKWWSDRRSRPV